MIENITAEEIAQHYSAALDSVNLVNELLELETLNSWQTDSLNRNVEHLELIVAKDFWTTEDLEPLTAAIEAAK